MNFTIRQMAAEDIAAIRQTAEDSWHHTYEGIIPLDVQDRFLQSAYSPDMMERRMKQSLVLVASMDDRIAGFVNFSLPKEDGTCELKAIYLQPEHQKAGIGSALLRNGIQRLGDARAIELTVEAENTGGRSFYEAHGFRIIDRFTEDFDGHILQSVRMRRELDT